MTNWRRQIEEWQWMKENKIDIWKCEKLLYQYLFPEDFPHEVPSPRWVSYILLTFTWSKTGSATGAGLDEASYESGLLLLSGLVVGDARLCDTKLSTNSAAEAEVGEPIFCKKNDCILKSLQFLNVFFLCGLYQLSPISITFPTINDVLTIAKNSRKNDHKTFFLEGYRHIKSLQRAFITLIV